MDSNGHRERLRRRYLQAGLDAFAPHEVLELLLTYAIPRRDVKPLAHALLDRFGSLHAVLNASPGELVQVTGMGENAAVLISMLVPLFRAYRQSAERDVPEIRDIAQAVRYCEALFEGERYEKFYVIALDARMRRINTALISTGDVTEVRVYARHVVNALTCCGAVGALIAHNHPGGTARPSQEDLTLTELIARLLGDLDIRLYDHIIVSPTENFSFRKAGLLGRLPDSERQEGSGAEAKRGECAKCVGTEIGDFHS